VPPVSDVDGSRLGHNARDHLLTYMPKQQNSCHSALGTSTNDAIDPDVSGVFDPRFERAIEAFAKLFPDRRFGGGARVVVRLGGVPGPPVGSFDQLSRAPELSSGPGRRSSFVSR
jgi:hypothetical protein